MLNKELQSVARVNYVLNEKNVALDDVITVEVKSNLNLAAGLGCVAV